eukprot:Skav207768  [mRNA]  locus=scaffold2087:129268:130623:- [translate_table: standard]
MDVVYESKIQFSNYVEYTRQQVLSGYIFLDWFAIPQITARVPGVNEDDTRSDAALAVQSIPFYVEASNIFLALVPEVKHQDTHKFCNYTSWLSRGWCRAELWCHLLSNKPFTQVIVVYSIKESQFMYPRDWQENTIDQGEFTVESDRSVVKRLGEVAVEHKIQNLSTAGPLNFYRFFLARQPRMLGQTPVTRNLEDFLRDFKFENLDALIKDQSSMNPVLCATFAGDTEMVGSLAAQRADLHLELDGLEELGYSNGWNLLMVALESRQSPEMIGTLLDLGVDPNASTLEAGCVAGFVKCTGHIDELLRRKADFHSPHIPLGVTPLGRVSGTSNLETVMALLQLRCDPNPPLRGLGVTPLLSAVSLARGNPGGVDIVKSLLESAANPNVSARQSGFMWHSMMAIARAKVALLGRETCAPQTRSLATFPGCTPLLAGRSGGALTKLRSPASSQ